MDYLYCLLCCLILCSCGNKTKKKQEKAPVETTVATQEKIKYVNSIKITSPGKNKLYSFHDEIFITVENKKRFPIDSAEIYINGKKIATVGTDIKDFAYRLPDHQTGRTTIKVVAWHPEGKSGIATTYIQVKPDKAPQQYQWKILKTMPHDPSAYTQGLVYHNGYMYEGTGQYGESTLRKLDLQTGKVLSVLNNDPYLFGEGITIYQDKIYQITWRSRKGFIYDLKTFSLESTFDYDSEGWGITTAGNKLVMSDGTNKLYHIAPSSFSIIKEVEVYDHQGPVNQLNELEYIDGLVWANVWLTNRIVAIDPETGAVKGEVDLTGLLPVADQAKLDDKDDVLNGIAWNPEKKTFYLTGKRWPKMFEVKIEEK